MHKYPVLGIAGKKRSGKNTLGTIMKEKYGYKEFAFADALREIMYATNPWVDDPYNPGVVYRYAELIDRHGYEYTKENFPEVRRLLQYMGTEGVRKVIGENTWVDTCLKRVAAHNGPAVITDCRFLSEEVGLIKYGARIVKIERPSLDDLSETHASEAEVDRIRADWTLRNEGTIQDLEWWASTLHAGLNV